MSEVFPYKHINHSIFDVYPVNVFANPACSSNPKSDLKVTIPAVREDPLWRRKLGRLMCFSLHPIERKTIFLCVPHTFPASAFVDCFREICERFQREEAVFHCHTFAAIVAVDGSNEMFPSRLSFGQPTIAQVTLLFGWNETIAINRGGRGIR
jgi:hypothetical protein